MLHLYKQQYPILTVYGMSELTLLYLLATISNSKAENQGQRFTGLIIVNNNVLRFQAKVKEFQPLSGSVTELRHQPSVPAPWQWIGQVKHVFFTLWRALNSVSKECWRNVSGIFSLQFWCPDLSLSSFQLHGQSARMQVGVYPVKPCPVLSRIQLWPRVMTAFHRPPNTDPVSSSPLYDCPSCLVTCTAHLFPTCLETLPQIA